MMGFNLRNPSGKGVGAAITQQVNAASMGKQFASQRFSREHMSPGAAGSEHEGWPHNSLPANRRRVSANIIPIPSPSASIEDPPYDRNGSVIPLVVIRCKLEAMLMTA